MFKILVAVDTSDHSRKIVKDALRIAVPLKAEVTVLTVEDWNAVDRSVGKGALEAAETAAAAFRAEGLEVDTLVEKGTRRPSDVICETAHEGEYDLVIMGSRGLRGIQEMFLGSVSHRVAHLIDRNVLIVK